jgi:hypothetical protein
VQLRTIDRARQCQRSGSTPHDPITAGQRSLPDLFLLACRPPSPSSHSSTQFADICTGNHSVQRTARSVAPTCSSRLDRKIIAAPAALSCRQHRPRAQIPIAFLRHRSPAAPPPHDPPPRFRALALFGRRPPERAESCVLAGGRKPAQELTPAAQQTIPHSISSWARASCQAG